MPSQPELRVPPEELQLRRENWQRPQRKLRGTLAAYRAGVGGADSVTLLGKIEIIEDMEVKKALWQDWFICHFPKGVNDPEYCVLKFSANEATFWIDSRFETHSC